MGDATGSPRTAERSPPFRWSVATRSGRYSSDQTSSYSRSHAVLRSAVQTVSIATIATLSYRGRDHDSGHPDHRRTDDDTGWAVFHRREQSARRGSWRTHPVTTGPSRSANAHTGSPTRTTVVSYGLLCSFTGGSPTRPGEPPVPTCDTPSRSLWLGRAPIPAIGSRTASYGPGIEASVPLPLWSGFCGVRLESLCGNRRVGRPVRRAPTAPTPPERHRLGYTGRRTVRYPRRVECQRRVGERVPGDRNDRPRHLSTVV